MYKLKPKRLPVFNLITAVNFDLPNEKQKKK